MAIHSCLLSAGGYIYPDGPRVLWVANATLLPCQKYLIEPEAKVVISVIYSYNFKPYYIISEFNAINLIDNVIMAFVTLGRLIQFESLAVKRLDVLTVCYFLGSNRMPAQLFFIHVVTPSCLQLRHPYSCNKENWHSFLSTRQYCMQDC